MILTLSRDNLQSIYRNKELDAIAINDFINPTPSIISYATIAAIVDGAKVMLIKNKHNRKRGAISRIEYEIMCTKFLNQNANNDVDEDEDED